MNSAIGRPRVSSCLSVYPFKPPIPGPELVRTNYPTFLRFHLLPVYPPPIFFHPCPPCPHDPRKFSVFHPPTSRYRRQFFCQRRTVTGAQLYSVCMSIMYEYASRLFIFASITSLKIIKFHSHAKDKIMSTSTLLSSQKACQKKGFSVPLIGNFVQIGPKRCLRNEKTLY